MDKSSFIVFNKDKEFKDGHSHISNFHIGKIMIYCCLTGGFPSRSKHLEKDERIVQSIVRICSNKYKSKFEDMLFKIKNKEDG